MRCLLIRLDAPLMSFGGTVVDLVDAGVRARQDDALQLAIGCVLADPIAADIAGVNLAIHMRLTHAAGNQLSDLGAEIEDEDFVVLHGGRRLKKRF